MKLSKINQPAMIAELIGTFFLALAVLASLHGAFDITLFGESAPLPTALVAGLALGLGVLTIGHISGSHVNPAVTIGLYSLRKIDGINTIAYILAQIVGGLLAMVAMSMFQDGILIAQVEAVADYPTFFAEFLGAFAFTFGIAAAVHQKLKGRQL